MNALTLSRQIRAESPNATLVLLPSLGTTLRVWDPLLRELAGVGQIDVLLFDLPGHGGTASDDVSSIPALAREAVDQIERARRRGPTIVVGVSMGGALAIEIAGHQPDGIDGFATFNSGLRFGTPAGWDAIIALVRLEATAAFDPDSTREGWFTAAFTAGRGAAVVEETLAELAAVDTEGYIACCSALALYDGTSALTEMAIPGLSVGGTADRATPAAGMRALAASNPRIRYAELPGAHLAIIENAAEAAALLNELLDSVIASSNANTNANAKEGAN